MCWCWSRKSRNLDQKRPHLWHAGAGARGAGREYSGLGTGAAAGRAAGGVAHSLGSLAERGIDVHYLASTARRWAGWLGWRGGGAGAAWAWFEGTRAAGGRWSGGVLQTGNQDLPEFQQDGLLLHSLFLMAHANHLDDLLRCLLTNLNLNLNLLIHWSSSWRQMIGNILILTQIYIFYPLSFQQLYF